MNSANEIKAEGRRLKAERNKPAQIAANRGKSHDVAQEFITPAFSFIGFASFGGYFPASQSKPSRSQSNHIRGFFSSIGFSQAIGMAAKERAVDSRSGSVG